MSKRGIKLYIQDINDSIARIGNYIKDLTFDEFVKDDKTIDAVIRNLFVIGEAVRNIPEEVKLKNSDIPWDEIIGMRNKIIHEYFGVEEDILWKTIKEDLPEFKEKISRLSY